MGIEPANLCAKGEYSDHCANQSLTTKRLFFN
jgi:hypothetical protein